jgi:3-deoxy-manno-octulosonate cytidylyltransferase (CMP-KDO synthetase)
MKISLCSLPSTEAISDKKKTHYFYSKGIQSYVSNPSLLWQEGEASMTQKLLVPDLSEWLVVVPARLDSQRLPRKPLADLGGVALIVRVLRNLQILAEKGALIVCATDSQEVIDAVEKSGFKAVLTLPTHQSGTDRCAEVSQVFKKPFVLNVQGDEPFVNTHDLLTLCGRFQADKAAQMGTLVHSSRNHEDFYNPNIVKVVPSYQGYALYFSRSPIPYHRDQGGFQGFFLQHIGVYAFRRENLLSFGGLHHDYPPLCGERHVLEEVEKLEQLRALQSGWKILLSEAREKSRGIDTPEDLEIANKLLGASMTEGDG